MADRQPFEYGSGCSGPFVSIGEIEFLPICSFPSFTSPTLALHHIDMSVPDLAPPPLCPCIWTFKANPFDIKFTQIPPEQASCSLWVVPMPPNPDRDCCEPTFNMSGSLILPCMPFSMNHVESINLGKIEVKFDKAPDECRLSLDIKISLPCMPFSVVVDPKINIGKFEFTVSQVDCQLKLHPSISLPSVSCMLFSVAVDTPKINFGKFVFDVSQGSCQLKIHPSISLPCMPFDVIGSGSINIGTLGIDVTEDDVNCELKLKAKANLPATWIYVVDSVGFDGTNFTYHTKRLRVYEVEDGSSTTWATAEPCPSS